jgi:hypothetical protein
MIQVELNSREATRVAKALERGINTFDSNSRDEKNVREAFALVLERIRFRDKLRSFSLVIPPAKRTKRNVA